MEQKTEITVPFLPARLNKEATVFGGLTMSELGWSALVGFCAGLILGVLLWVIARYWLIIPFSATALSAALVLSGKRVVAGIKRGKPESYLNRLIEFKLDGWLGRNEFIRREGAWSIRALRKQKGSPK